MSEIFIIDEWLWSDLNGDNGTQKQKEAFSFLETLYEKCDKIAVAKGSKFQQKAWDFSRKASEDADTTKRRTARVYFYDIMSNPQKYKEVDIEGEEWPDLGDINPDDHYLVKTHYKTNATIITTDNKLMKILESKGIPCKLRDEFLKKYNV